MFVYHSMNSTGEIFQSWTENVICLASKLLYIIWRLIFGAALWKRSDFSLLTIHCIMLLIVCRFFLNGTSIKCVHFFHNSIDASSFLMMNMFYEITDARLTCDFELNYDVIAVLYYFHGSFDKSKILFTFISLFPFSLTFFMKNSWLRFASYSNE